MLKYYKKNNNGIGRDELQKSFIKLNRQPYIRTHVPTPNCIFVTLRLCKSSGGGGGGGSELRVVTLTNYPGLLTDCKSSRLSNSTPMTSVKAPVVFHQQVICWLLFGTIMIVTFSKYNNTDLNR